MPTTTTIPPMSIRASPYQHQRAAYEFALDLFGLNGEPKSHGCALLLEMGTGKSLTAIAITGALYQADRINRVLIVAPLSILGVWQEEFMKFAAFDYSLTVLSGSSEQKEDTLRRLTDKSLQVAVVNYESAWRIEKALHAWRPDLVICDEGHKIKTHNTSASKAMHRIGARAAYRLLLTGTPVSNKALDIFSQYKFLNPTLSIKIGILIV